MTHRTQKTTWLTVSFLALAVTFWLSRETPNPILAREPNPQGPGIAPPASLPPTTEQPLVENTSLSLKYAASATGRPVAEQINAVLGQYSNLKFKNLSLVELVRILRDNSALPIYLDQQSFRECGVDPMIKLEANVPGSSLKGILFAALRPHGIEAVVENDLLLFKVNYEAHALSGGKTTMWTSIDDEVTESLLRKLGQLCSGNYNKIPLEDLVRDISTKQGLPMVINTRALEDIGLTRDVPITVNLRDVTTLEFMNIALEENDLILSVGNGVLRITTQEDANSEDAMQSRTYWLDGTGIKQPEKAAQIIVSTVSPHAWEEFGGPATIEPLTTDSGRSVLVVSATLPVHLQIENLLNSLRGLPSKPARIGNPQEPAALALPPVNRPIRPAPNADDPFSRPGGRASDDDPFGGS